MHSGVKYSSLFVFLNLCSRKTTVIRLTDQLRLLDQDMIRLQQKVNTVLELKEENVIL